MDHTEKNKEINQATIDANRMTVAAIKDLEIKYAPIRANKLTGTTGTLTVDKVHAFPPDHLRDTVADFKDVAYSQEFIGIEKYGKPLDPLDLNYDWLDMATEEQVDGFKYLRAEKKKRNFIADKIQNIIAISRIDEDHAKEILFWLDELRGKGKKTK